MKKKPNIRWGWHILPSNSYCRHTAQRVRVGEWVRAKDHFGQDVTPDNPPVLCEFGMHACNTIAECCNWSRIYANVLICRVQVRGCITEHTKRIDRKFAGCERKVLWMISPNQLLRACQTHPRLRQLDTVLSALDTQHTMMDDKLQRAVDRAAQRAHRQQLKRK